MSFFLREQRISLKNQDFFSPITANNIEKPLRCGGRGKSEISRRGVKMLFYTILFLLNRQLEKVMPIAPRITTETHSQNSTTINTNIRIDCRFIIKPPVSVLVRLATDMIIYTGRL